MKRIIVFLILTAIFCTGCNTPPTVTLSIVNTSDKPVEVSIGDETPRELAPNRSLVKKAQLNEVVMAGDKVFDLIPDEFGDHRAAVLVVGPKRPMLLADYSDFYGKKGEELKTDANIKLIGIVDKDVFPFGEGVSDIQIATPGYMAKYSGKHAYRLVPLPPGLPEEQHLDYLNREMAMVLQSDKALKESGLNLPGQNRYRRFMPESGWTPPVEDLKSGDGVSITVFNLSPNPIAFRRNEDKLAVIIPKGEIARWLSARRTDTVKLMESNGQPMNTDGKTLREIKVSDVLAKTEEHFLLVNDPKQKFEFLLADFTTLAEGRPPVVGDIVRAKDDVAVLEPYDLVWGLENRMPPLVQMPGRIMKLMVIKPDVPESKYRVWAEAGLNYVQKQMKAGTYK